MLCSNNSYGLASASTATSNALRNAINQAAQQGHVFVVAAGGHTFLGW
jgi:hypothetical protein